MKFPGIIALKLAPRWLPVLWLLFCSHTLRADTPVAVDDFAVTPPNTSVTIAVLTNDFISSSNATAILRVTQPAHGRVVIDSTPANHAELTPLFQFAATQLSNTVVQVAITNLYPWYLTNGVWVGRVVDDNDWICGFFPGSLWMIYEYTGDTNYQVWAERWMAAIAAEQFSTNTDDVGFMINTSFGNGYRLTGNPGYKAVLLQAAQSLSVRFNAVVGCLADDRLLTPPPFEVIMDTMMNTELLHVAHDLGGGANLLNIAVSHAGRTMTNHLRADGSTYHRVMYDSVTNGSVLFRDNRALPGQPLDTWARGHAWATYAFPVVFRETGDARFLDTAKKVADFYISHAPADYVPYWYYPSNSVNTNLLRDSSAASITLAGLLDLSQQVTNADDGAKYWLAAHHLFRSISSTNYLAVGTTNAILLHGNPVDSNTDTSLIYGDYYFIESLKRLNDVFNQTTLTYVPATNFTGTDTFTCQVCDSSGATATATVTVTVGLMAQISLSPATHWPVISFPTSVARNYFVQSLDSLAPPAIWNGLATNIPGSGSVVSITDTNPPDRRFYRAGVE
ncbi:MAG: glycoside hydrolase family 88 protein [Verrucomicrobiales bacterium]|nr:glycoside hydrolase family 88 protein [Verrucomicrobiales bacterium]